LDAHKESITAACAGDSQHHAGFRTREYVIFGGEWWLYDLNRIAE
jgi:hypothetical protein